MEEPEKKKVRLIKALDSLIYMPKVKQLREDIEVPGLVLNQQQDYLMVSDDLSSPAGDRKRRDVPSIGRPWDRGELYARLQTFKSMTWFAKSESINARECARRGWENSGIDELTCETCRVVLKYPTVESEDCEAALVERFEGNLSRAHGSLCPWRSAVCSLSLLEFPKHLSCSTIVADFKSRSMALKKLLCIPPIAEQALDTILPDSHPTKTSLYVIKKGVQLQGSKKEWEESPEFSNDALRETRQSLQKSVVPYLERDQFMARVHVLALCGWSLRILSPEGSKSYDGAGHCLPEHSALQCSLCGSKVGLWSFFEGCKPKPFSTASLAQKSGPIYNTSKSSFMLNQQVAMNMTTTIAGGMLHQMDDVLLADGPFGKPEPEHAQPFASPGSAHVSQNGVSIPKKESVSSVKSKAPQRQSQKIALAQYAAACNSTIDPLDSHRSFCPWANPPRIGGEDESKSGWEIYVENLAAGPADLLVGATEWQGKDVFRKVMASVGKFHHT